jgi:hypothetical protein
MLLMSPLFTIFGGVLAFGLVDDDSGLIAGWKILLLVEGLPAIVVGVVLFFILAYEPKDATWLTDAEKHVATRRMVAGGGHGFDRKALYRALTDPEQWMCSP